MRKPPAESLNILRLSILPDCTQNSAKQRQNDVGAHSRPTLDDLNVPIAHCFKNVHNAHMDAEASPAIPPTLTAAVAAVLQPLARLAVAKGIPARDLEEMLRIALVAAARESLPDGQAARQVSRIAGATGLTRREVTRLVDTEAELPAPTRSPATQVFARWVTSPDYAGPDGRPLALQRQGQAPSFESLAQSVTRDVHPRSLLETLVALRLVEEDAAAGRVRLLKDRYVPDAADDRLWNLLGGNVGDHFNAAVANVAGGDPRHVEQAVFADGLSPESLPAVHRLAQAQWQAAVRALVPALQQLIDADREADRPGTQRVRIGLYSYSAPAADTHSRPDKAAAEPEGDTP